MGELIYNGIRLCLYQSHKDYVDSLAKEYDEIECVYTNANGDIVPIDDDSIDWSKAQMKEHFSDDSTFQPASLHWEVWSEEKRIHCIILSPILNISLQEIMESLGHEYGHIVRADEVKDAIAPYETEEGYRQEEEKGQWFERFVKDIYQMTGLYIKMFSETGIKIELFQIENSTS